MGGSTPKHSASSRTVVLYRGKPLGPTALAAIRRLIRSQRGLTRRVLCRKLCERFGWRRPNGDLATRSCLELLARLERRGLLTLPASSRGDALRPRLSGPRAESGDSPPAPFELPASPTPPLVVRPILEMEQATWRWWIQRFHYLGCRPLIGESIRYVAFWQRQPAAVLGWASATLHNAARDEFIGWDAETRRHRLHRVVSNVRFLMLPSVSERHLASRILAANLRRLGSDWQRAYAHPVWLAETFVDPSRFQGTCYRASNWMELGQTSGWSRSGFRYQRNDRPKIIFVYPLVARAVERLRDPQNREVPIVGEVKPMLDVEKVPLQGEGGLFDVLQEIPDPRDRRGLRHSSRFILAITICAKLSGARSLEAIAQWAEDQPIEVLKRLGCRGRRPPSEPTLRRLLKRIDPEELDRRLNQWTAQQTDLEGKGIAIDGKTVRGSRDKEEPPVHLVGAIVHGEGLVVAQTRVADKTNEIKSVEPLLENLPIEGAVVTGDAMYAQKEVAKYVVEQKKADYVFTVKDNQPTLKKDIEDLGLEAFPPSGPDKRQGARSAGDAADLDE